MAPLANTNLHLLQEGTFSSNAFSFSWGWGPGQYDGPTWNAHFYRYSGQKEGRKNMSLCVSEVWVLDAWVSYVISNHPSSVFEACVFCLLWCPLLTFFHLPGQWEVRFHEVSMSGTMVRNLVFDLPAHSAAFRAQGANMYICLAWATVQVFFCSSSLKYMCNWAAHFHIWGCPGGVSAVKSKPKFYIMQLP